MEEKDGGREEEGLLGGGSDREAPDSARSTGSASGGRRSKARAGVKSAGRVGILSYATLEFVNTFFFVLLCCGTRLSGSALTMSFSSDELTIGRIMISSLGAGLAACAIMYNAFAIFSAMNPPGEESGAVINHRGQPSRLPVGHLNPVVTFATLVMQDLPLKLGLTYIAAQFAGAFAAVGFIMGTLEIAGDTDLGATVPHEELSPLQVTLVETLLSTVLVFGIFVFYLRKEAPPSPGVLHIAPVVVGLLIAVLSVVGMPLSGAGMNPARSVAPAVLSNTLNVQWAYWVGPALGALFGTIIFRAYETDAGPAPDSSKVFGGAVDARA